MNSSTAVVMPLGSSISFLDNEETLRGYFDEAGFTVSAWRDVTEPSREWFAQMVARNKEQGPPPLGLHVLVGSDMKDKAVTLLRNFEEQRVRVVQILGE